MSPGRTLLRKIGILFLAVVLPIKAGFAQQPSDAKRYVPIEVQPVDPEIKALLETARTDSDLGNYDVAFSKMKNALELARTKGFVGDKAIAEEAVAVGYFASGQLDESFRFYQSGLQDAVDSSNLVLQADVLVSLAMLPQLQGKLQAASDLLIKAQKAADESKNSYIRSRVLGELGKLEITSGKSDLGLQSLEEALNIDRVNHYDFEPLHMVYATGAILSQPKPDFAKAISQLESARDLAIEKGNYIAFVLAQNALGAIYPNTGELQKGIAMLEATLNGNVLKDGQAVALPSAFRGAATLPFMKAVLLEGLGRAYQVGQQPDKALEAWGQLYSLSVNGGLKLTEAEAARAIAEIYKSKQDIPNALNYFSIATQTWRTLQNDQQLSDALISEALFLTKSEKGEQAIPLETEVAEIAAKNQNRSLLFSSNMVLAEIYQPLNRIDEARTVLEKAQSLIKPGPADTEVDNKLVVETYARLADVYKALHLPIKELVALEKAVAVLQTLKDDEHRQQMVAYLKGRLEALQVQELATKAATEGRPADSLWYSEILYVWYGKPADPSKDENWTRLLTLSAQIIKQPDGAQALDEILIEMGSLIGDLKLPILEDLSNYFLTDLKPGLVERYASEAESLARQIQDSSNTFLVIPVCQLTLAYAQEGRTELAKQKAVECRTIAESTHDPTSTNLANAAITTAQIADLSSADENSLKSLLAASPEVPEFHSAVGFTLAGKKAYKEAIEEFRLAIELYRRIGNGNAVASVYKAMADALQGTDSKEFKAARLDSLQSSKNWYHEANNPNAEASIDIDIGTYYVNEGDFKSAVPYFQSADSLAQQLRDSKLIARAAWMMGNAYLNLLDFQSAERLHEKAATTFHQIGDVVAEGWNLMDLCQDLQAQQRYDAALETCRRAEGISRQSASPIVQYWVQKTLGEIYYSQGDLEKSTTAAEKAAVAAGEAGESPESASAYLRSAELYEILGDWEDAARNAEKAFELFKGIGNTNGEALAAADLVEIYGDRNSSIRDLGQATEYYSTTKQLTPENNIADINFYLQAGKFSDAITASQAGIKTCGLATIPAECQAEWLISLAEAQRKSGDLRASASSLNEAAGLAAKSKDLYLQGRLFYGLAGQARTEGHYEEASQYYKQVISLIETVKGRGSSKAEHTLSEGYGFIYDEMTSTIYALTANKTSADKAKLASEALEYTETNKAREFSESWGRSFITELRHGLPANLQEKERSLITKRDQLEAKLAGDIPLDDKASLDPAPQLKADLSTVQMEIDSFVGDLRRNERQYSTVAYPEPVALEHLPLRKGETLFEFRVTDESTFVWVLRNPNGTKTELVAFYQVSKSREWLSERVKKIHDALDHTQGRIVDWRISEELFGQLFPGELSKVLLGSPKLIFIPDDILFLVPFELLSPDASKGAFPLLGVATTYYPSAAALRLARAAVHGATWQEAFLGIADPITSPDDKRYDSAPALEKVNPAPTVSAKLESSVPPDIDKITSRGYRFDPLPDTKDEVEHIAALFREKGETIETRVGFTATKSQLLETDLTKFRFLHFATHGILAVDSNIREPALVLSYDGSVQHMFLSMSEIVSLRIRAEMVVLSACDTGNGMVSRAEGVMSLGRAFMAGGAESVTVSLWEVSDESTQILMEEYYRNLIAGKSKAEALAAARSFLFTKDKRFANPFYWAPFVLIGD